jgi:hypothetical protein
LLTAGYFLREKCKVTHMQWRSAVDCGRPPGGGIHLDRLERLQAHAPGAVDTERDGQREMLAG